MHAKNLPLEYELQQTVVKARNGFLSKSRFKLMMRLQPGTSLAPDPANNKDI